VYLSVRDHADHQNDRRRHSYRHNDCAIQSAELANPTSDYRVSICCGQRAMFWDESLRHGSLSFWVNQCSSKMSAARAA
jgi:hypothetical protein